MATDMNQTKTLFLTTIKTETLAVLVLGRLDFG